MISSRKIFWRGVGGAVFAVALLFSFQSFAQTALERETAEINARNNAIRAQLVQMRAQLQPLLIKAATVQLTSDYWGQTPEEDFLKTGTGTVVGSFPSPTRQNPQRYTSYVLTADHVVSSSSRSKPHATNTELYDLKGEVTGTVSFTVVYRDPSKDLALVRIYTDKQLPSFPITGPDDVVKQGDRIIAVGCRRGIPPRVYTGPDACITGLNSRGGDVFFDHFTISDSADGGDSGGPCVVDGKIVGVCHAKVVNKFDSTLPGQGIYVSSLEVRRFMAAAANAVLGIALEAGRIVNEPLTNAPSPFAPSMPMREFVPVR